MKQVAKVIIGSLSIGICMILFFITLFNIKSYKTNKNWLTIKKSKTIGKVIGWESRGAKGGQSAVLEYSINDKKHRKYINHNRVLGEKFMVEYDVENHENAIVLEDNPIFEKYEKTSFTIGKLTEINNLIFNSIDYSYFNSKYLDKDSQSFHSETDKKYSNIEEEQLFVVEYLTENPRRSKIHLDKPINLNKIYWWKYKIDSIGNILK